MAGEQSIQLINALAFARGTQEPTNRNVLWIDDSIVGALYKRVKIYDKDSESWVLSSRTDLELLSDLRTVDGAGSGLDADTLQGYTPDDFLGNSAESLSVGQLLVGQADTVGVSKTLAGIATIDASGNLIYTSGSISHTGLTNIGTNTHAQIDSHISSTANPHTVTASQVGNTVSQWNASSIEGNVTNLGTLGSSDNGKVISWDNATSRFVMSNINDDSIYANDGTLAGNRAVNGSGTRSLSFGNDVASENLSILKINSIQGLEKFANTFPFANAGLEVTKNPGNFIANLKASATDSVKIQLTSDEHRVNSVLGTNNLQQINSSSISSTIVSNGGAGTTARLDLLGSGKVDLGTSGTVGASLVLDSTNSFTDRNATPKGLEYSADYSANFSNRSLVDKEYVDNNAGGDSIYTADGTLSGNRIVNLDGNKLTFNIGATGTDDRFLIDGSSVTANDTDIFTIQGVSNKLTVNEDGYIKNQNVQNNEALYLSNSVGSYGIASRSVNNMFVNTNQYFVDSFGSTNYIQVYSQDPANGIRWVKQGNVQQHWIRSGNLDRAWFFMDGVNGTSGFIVGAQTKVSTENISLQGSTLIKGEGTSTGTTLALYDNDTTPVKTWEWLDNGNVNLGVNSVLNLGGNQLSFDGAAGSLIIMKDDGTLELGLGSNAGTKFEVAVGNLANASGVTSIAVGYNSQSTTDFTIAIGRNANATHTRTTIIGAQSSSSGSSATSLGYGVGVGASGTSIGYISDAGTNAVALGNVAQATGSSSIAIGSKATASGSKSIMISNDGLAVTNNVANSLALSFDQSGHIFFAGLTADSYFNGSGNFGFGITSPTAKLHVEGTSKLNGVLDMNNNRITNSVVNPSVQEVTSSATFTINADQQTDGVLTAMAAATTIAAPTGTPVQSQSLIFRFKDDGTARAITWNAIFRAIGITLPTTTTASKLLYVGCKYNSTDTKWDVVSVQEEA